MPFDRDHYEEQLNNPQVILISIIVLWNFKSTK